MEGDIKGKFIVLEGLDGSGKSTQAKRLVERLNLSGIKAVSLREPTDGQWGRKIREIAAKGREGITPEEELSYFVNDRREDVEKNIIPALNDGMVVVMDRYIYSNMAYQGALGIDVDHIAEINREFPRPDLVIFLDFKPGEGLGRVEMRGAANAGFEKREFLEKVYETYQLPQFEIMSRISAKGSVEEVGERIWGVVAPYLEDFQ
ncbi:MAG: dTMP kinase [Nitrospinota bacterium]|nr:dTMP kinase [Nitrospinota bacterium]